MTDLRTAAQQALEALEQSETTVPYEGFGMARREAERKHQAAITALRAALAQQAEPVSVAAAMRDARLNAGWGSPPQQAEPVEPVAQYSDIVSDGGMDPRNKYDTAPPQRKPLTEEEIDALPWNGSPRQFARAIERAHGIKE